MYHIVTSIRCDGCGDFSPWSLSSETELRRGEVWILANDRGWRIKPQGDGKPSHHLCPACVEKDPWMF